MLVGGASYRWGWKEDGARLFALVPSGRTRGSVHKLKHRKVCVNIRKSFFYWGWPSTGTGCSGRWNLYPWRYSEAICTVMGNLLIVGPTWAGEIGPVDLQRSLTTSTILILFLAWTVVNYRRNFLWRYQGLNTAKAFCTTEMQVVVFVCPRYWGRITSLWTICQPCFCKFSKARDPKPSFGIFFFFLVF